MKEKHWKEHLKELELRREHKERRRANSAARRAVMELAGITPKREGLYLRSGGEAAAVAWFQSLPAEEQTRVVSPSPSGDCKRGRARVVRAFQHHLVKVRDKLKEVNDGLP